MKDKLKHKTEDGSKDCEASGTQRRARRREADEEQATQKRLGRQEIQILELALHAKADEVLALAKEASRYIAGCFSCFIGLYMIFEN